MKQYDESTSLTDKTHVLSSFVRNLSEELNVRNQRCDYLVLSLLQVLKKCSSRYLLLRGNGLKIGTSWIPEVPLCISGQQCLHLFVSQTGE